MTVARNHDAIGYAGERGPSWYDVWITQRELEELLQKPVHVKVRPTGSVNKQWGFYLQLEVDGQEVQGFGSGFGKAYENKPLTMPAAMYTILTRVYHHFEMLGPMMREVELQRLRRRLSDADDELGG